MTALEKDYFGFSEKEFQLVQEFSLLLCEEIGNVVVKIIDAIAFPDHIVNSVLGCADGKVYERYTEQVEKAHGCYVNPAISTMKEVRKLIN